MTCVCQSAKIHFFFNISRHVRKNVYLCSRKAKSEKWKVESGTWKVKSEKWKVESGKWKVKSEK